MSKIAAVARRGGEDGHVFMTNVAGAHGTATQTCDVVDADTGHRWTGLKVQSVLARGYWEPFEGEVEVPDTSTQAGPADAT